MMSTQATHTPGPWTWVDIANEWDDGPLARLVDSTGDDVLNFGDNTQYYPTEGLEPTKADARLIAGSPELLKAAQSAQDMILTTFIMPVRLLVPQWNDVLALLEDAIQNAEKGNP